jgi:hypothetical protein
VSGRERPATFTVTAILMLLTAAGTLVFWVAFFAGYEAQRDCYLAQECNCWFPWERSFPAADAWTAALCILGATGLWRVRPAGLLYSLVAGGALVFLGLIDALFFLQNGLYWPLNGDVAVELFIHVWTVTIGLSAIACVWPRRGYLLK